MYRNDEYFINELDKNLVLKEIFLKLGDMSVHRDENNYFHNEIMLFDDFIKVLKEKMECQHFVGQFL